MLSPRSSRSSRTSGRNSNDIRNFFNPHNGRKPPSSLDFLGSRCSARKSKHSRDGSQGLRDYSEYPCHYCKQVHQACMSGGLGLAGGARGFPGTGGGFGPELQAYSGEGPQFPVMGNEYPYFMEDPYFSAPSGLFPLSNLPLYSPQQVSSPGGQLPASEGPQFMGPGFKMGKACNHRGPLNCGVGLGPNVVNLERGRRPYNYVWPYAESVYGEEQMMMAMEQMRIAEGEGLGLRSQGGYFGGYGGVERGAGGVGMSMIGGGGLM